MKLRLAFLFALITNFAFSQLPQGFVYVNDLIPSIHVELRYFGSNNFMGNPIEGYHREVAILSKQAAIALKNVQNELQQYNLSVKIYDSYRPQRAVNHFIRWARNLNDTLNKQEYYPNVMKQHLFKEGYIAARSGHSRGSTLDMTLVDIKTGQPLDMGSPYDFFGNISWVDFKNLTAQQLANRMLIQTIMRKHGFMHYPKEWWHFTLRNEPFPETYFDFPVN
ncbi:D-Ala-D-Ala dipeptidase [hydrothermal vent metagenome]|uniref:D-Ala-D-Ala dipeptidase n=1 Tax=hydrothermal vent metagenome TaxID=652676 RepID=A0A3B0R171_9ZZZZ